MRSAKLFDLPNKESIQFLLHALMTANNPLRPYFDKLNKEEDFVPLLQEFIRSSVNEQYASETTNDEDGITYGMFMNILMCL